MKKRLGLYIRSAITLLRLAFIKLFNMRGFSAGLLQDFSLGTRLSISKNSKVALGKKIHSRGGVWIETMDGGDIEIGDGCVFNRGNMIVSGEKISIGEKTAFGPYVTVYDHDHDTCRTEENESVLHCSPVRIGSRVWIGANTVILRGTDIGDGCVIGAGSVIKGTYPPNTVVIQKRAEEIRKAAVYDTVEKGGKDIGGEGEHTRLEGMVQGA